MPPTEDAPDSMPADWEDRIAALLRDLSGVQTDLLNLLSRKREMVASRDAGGLQTLEPEEQSLVDRLGACCQQRQHLLDEAERSGLPSRSLQTLAGALPGESRRRLQTDLRDARRRSRLVQHQSLANWVLVQRSLLHLSQMMEIIATGGRMRPTYGNEPSGQSGGAIVDQAV